MLLLLIANQEPYDGREDRIASGLFRWDIAYE